MKINDILFKIKTALSLENRAICDAYALVGYEMSQERLENILKKHQDKGYEEATYEELGLFLDGLVLSKEAKELMEFHQKLEVYNESKITKKYIYIQAPLCSKAKALFKEAKWVVLL